MGRVSREKAVEHRRALLKVAQRLFQERGPEDVGVAEITAGIGLTHGGFYRQFASKEALLSEAIETALRAMSDQIKTQRQQAGNLDCLTDLYLSPAHIADIGGGCPVAALAGDMPRQTQPVREAFAEGLRIYLEALGVEDLADNETHAQVLNKIACLLGALIIVRAVADTDDELAQAFLNAVGTEPVKESS